MRTVAGHHGHEDAAHLLIAIELGQHIFNSKVGDPIAFGKAIGIVTRGMDIGLEMHIGIGRGSHDVSWLHFDRLQIDGGNLHAAHQFRLANGIFQRVGS